MAIVYVQALVGVLEASFFTGKAFPSGVVSAEEAQELFQAAARDAQADDLGVLLTLQTACAQAPDLQVNLAVTALH